MRATRFWAELFEAILAQDPKAVWTPPSREGAADDFVTLRDGSVIPNPSRAEEWLGLPAPRPRLQLVPPPAPPSRGRRRRPA